MTVNAQSQALFNANAVLASKGRSFYWARKLLGAKHAERATRLYGFCRYVDDLADEAQSVSAAKQALAETAQDIAAGRSQQPVVSDMIALIQECDINPSCVQELINGVTSDLDLVRMKDLPQLLRYCYRVAGTVGLMMSAVLDVQDTTAAPFAIDLGIAMQLTNICRDVSEDAMQNRRYLPASILGDIEPEALTHNAVFAKHTIATLLDLADRYYKSGESGLAFLPLGARAGIFVAARIYRGIGTDLRKRDFAYWTQRAVVSTPIKAKLTAQALLSFTFNRALWQNCESHDDQLHTALLGLPGVKYGL